MGVRPGRDRVQKAPTEDLRRPKMPRGAPVIRYEGKRGASWRIEPSLVRGLPPVADRPACAVSGARPFGCAWLGS